MKSGDDWRVVERALTAFVALASDEVYAWNHGGVDWFVGVIVFPYWFA